MKIDPEHYAVAIYLCEMCSGNKRNIKRNNRKLSRQSTNQRLGEVEMVPQPPNAPPGHKYFVSLLKEGLCVKQGAASFQIFFLNHSNLHPDQVIVSEFFMIID